jgi:hypothetical protein
MNNTYLMTALIAPSFVWMAAQVLWYWPRLPDRIASHFNGRLEPDNWMRKGRFVLVYAATMIGLALVAVFFVPSIVPALYFVAAVFHFAFAFDFNVKPERERLSKMLWVLTVVFVLATSVFGILMK